MTWLWILLAAIVGGVIGAVAVTYYIGHGMFRRM